MDKTKIEDVEKYQTTYYSYELDKVKTEEVYDGTFIVSLNSEITFSNQYDVTPREGKKISELTEELQDLVDYT